MSKLSFDFNNTAPTAPEKIEGKDFAGKIRPTLVPPEAIRAIARVREYGAIKYASDDNWKTVPVQYYVDALYRHLLAYIDDPNAKDSESGLPHIEHLLTNAAFLAALQNNSQEKG